MAQARGSADPVVASALTTETTIVTALPDGNYQAEISPVPVRVQDPQSGSWADIDNTMIQGEDGSIRPRMPGVPMSFSGGGDEPLVTIRDGDRSMAMSWPEDLPEPTLVGSSVQYESVLPGVDLIATAGALGFTTYVVVHSAAAAKHPMIRKLAFDVDAAGVQVSESAGSGIVAKDGGETVFRASQPLMWDAEGSPADKSARPDAVSPGDLRAEDEAAGAPLTPSSDVAPVPMAVDASNSEISVTPPASALSGPDTTWPVVIDPGFSATRDYGGRLITHWTMVWSNGLEFYDHPSEDARVGYDGWSSATKKSEAFYRIDISALNGAKIHSAIFRHQLLHSPNNDCNASSWGPAVQVGLTSEFTSSTTWSNRPGWWDSDRVASNSTVTGQEDTCPAKHLEWNLTGSVGIKAAENEDRIHIKMKSADDGDKNGWRRFNNSAGNPALNVIYSKAPVAPTNLSITGLHNQGARGRWTTDTTPQVLATVTSPNGAKAKAYFEILQGSTLKWSGSSPYVVSGSSGSATVPTALANGAFTLRAWSVAEPDPNYPDSPDLKSASYASLAFNIDNVRPPAPTIKKITKSCRVGSPCVFEFAGAVDPATGVMDTVTYHYGLNTDDANVGEITNLTAATARATLTPASFGPSWISAKSEDLAGNVGVAVSFLDDFRIQGSVLLHQWGFDSPTYTADSVPENKVVLATLPSTPTAAGRLGTNAADGAVLDPTDKALSLNGAESAASIGSTTPMDSSQDFSVSTWVKLDDTANRLILSQQGTSGNRFYLGYYQGAWQFAGWTADDVKITASLTDAAPTGKWVHLVGMYNAQTKLANGKHEVRLFVDGRTDDSMTTAVPATSSAGLEKATGPLLIGRGTNGGGEYHYWKGLIDDVRVFPGVLDQTQVRRIFSERRPA